MLHSLMVESFEAEMKIEGSTGDVVKSLIACSLELDSHW